MTTDEQAVENNGDKKGETPRACSVCGGEVPADADRCPTCGATQGDEHTCPFCGVVAKPEPHRELRFVCPACGAPRVPRTSSSRKSTALSTARSAQSSRAVWRVASGLAGAFGLFAALLLAGVTLVASPAAFPLMAAWAVASVPFVFAALALRNAGKRSAELHQSLDEAWLQAAKDRAADHGPLGVHDLEEAFDLDESQARDLLSRLAADAQVGTDVSDDGALLVSVHGSERLRVADPMRVEAAETKPATPDDTEEAVVPEDVSEDASESLSEDASKKAEP